MFNERIFFLIPHKQFGYISNSKNVPTAESIANAKAKVEFSDLKKIKYAENLMTIKYFGLEDNKKVEKIWNMRT